MVVRLYPRSSLDVSYFTSDPAHELDELRAGPAGRWLQGSGPVTEDSVARVFTPGPARRTVGYDIVIAAPRPLSILLAVDPASGPAVVAAHQHSVRDAVEYLQERGVVVRDRRFGGDEEDPGQWGNIAAFTHGINRHGEPHLHDHVLVGSQPVGSTTQLDARALAAHALTADALYRSALRAAVARTTPWVPWRSAQGTEHVRDLDEGYRALWGGHFDDRPAKVLPSRADVVARWADDQRRFLSVATVSPPSRDPHLLDEHGFAASFEGQYDVPRREVVAAVANAAVFGAARPTIEHFTDTYYPELRESRGLRETLLSVREVRRVALVASRGPRTLAEPTFDEPYRSRTRSWEPRDRSR
jgi:hypothetical protein